MTRALAVLLLAVSAADAGASSLRFYGNGVNDIDRVKIRIDDPALSSDPGPPVDVGATDFTVEFWLKGVLAENPGTVGCGSNSWITGNIVIDRDRFNQGRNYGISLGSGRVAFGAMDASGTAQTICGSTMILDGGWHHVAVQRALTGNLEIWVDGLLDGSGTGPAGDISYPDDGVPGPFCGGPCVNSDPFVVLGAEKHDAGPAYPSFSGWLDELRWSTVRRYGPSRRRARPSPRTLPPPRSTTWTKARATWSATPPAAAATASVASGARPPGRTGRPSRRSRPRTPRPSRAPAHSSGPTRTPRRSA